MKQYIFVKGREKNTVEAANYQEALAALIFKVGSEMEAAEYIFQSEMAPKTEAELLS